MQRFAVVVVLGLAWFSPKAHAEVQADAAARAKAVEASAFAAVEREHWCTAMDLFLEANGIVANADLVFNAAQAAEYAGDRARAVQLYTELLGHAPTAARKSASKKKIKTLTAMVEKDGAGPSCPPPDKKPAVETAAVAPPVVPVAPVVPVVAPNPVVTPSPPVVTPSPPVVTPSPAVVTPAPVVDKPATADAQPATSTEPVEATTTHVVVEALKPEHEPPPDVEAKVTPTWPWITAGVGGGVAVLGGIGLAVGVGQYAAFSAAVSDQDRTDDRSSAEFADASRRRDFYSDSWNTWGAPLAITSGIVMAGGVAAAAVGGALVVME
jgi:hypothetical protein